MNENFNEFEEEGEDEVEEAIREVARENQLKEISKNKAEALKSGELIEREITSEKIVQVLISDKFLEALRISSERTKATGNETRFYVSLYEDGEILVSSIEEGLMDSVGGGDSVIINEGEYPDLEKKRADLISLHYHPRMDKICPSEADLVSKLAPLQLIAIIDEKTIKVLLMSVAELGREGAEAITESLSHEPELSQSRIQKILKKNDINNLIISYILNDGKYELSKESQQKVIKIGSVTCEFFE